MTEARGMNRRELLQAAALAGAGVAALSGGEARAEEGAPVAIATWGHGVPAVARSGEVLAAGGSALDAAEQGVMVAELDPEVTSVGYGGYPNAAGAVELDACIIDGRTREAGAVASLRGCKTPIAVARKVMEDTRHVMLVGEGARRFATAHGFEHENLLTARSLAAWERWKEKSRKGEGARRSGDGGGQDVDDHDTIGLLALDAAGHLAAACTTSGLAWKLPGRVGDSPIVGAGLYAEDGVGAATATGVGEEVIKVCGSFLVVERMRAGDSPERACQVALERILARDPANAEIQCAFLALRADGAVGAASMGGGFSYGRWGSGGTTQVEVTAWR